MRAGPRKGRGACSNPPGRFEPRTVEPVDDGWPAGEPEPAPRTTVETDRARSVVTRNDSPDVPFDRSVNPYRGCEHGCIYCYARSGHARLGLSPGLDFETRLYAKPDAPRLLREALARPGYRCAPLALGAYTDPYQPVERRLRITRGILEVLAECRHPVMVTTKSAAVERDLDLLADMAREGLVEVAVSVCTLDHALARRLEPRATAPARRIETVRRLGTAGVPVRVLCAPVIPALNDHELERVLEAAAAAGARAAAYVLLRLPGEVRGLFEEWLAAHYPDRARRVLNALRAARGGRLGDARFGRRMTGEGEYARLLARRFALAARRHGLDRDLPPLDTSRFRPPGPFQPPLL